MDASGTDGSADFRPFFDMVIGILFVLLILVAAQIYFQQAQSDTATSEVAKREAEARRADITSFLDVLTQRLRSVGLAATVDYENQSVLLPLHDVLVVDAAGFPKAEVAPTAALGTALSELSSCVTLPRSADTGCSAFARLSLNHLAATVRVGALSPHAALTRERFGDLGSLLLAGQIMGNHPEIISASNSVGGRVVAFDTASTIPVGSDEGVGGDLVLDFTFR